MSSKIIKFSVPIKTAKLLKRILISCIILGLISMVMAIVMGTYRPSPQSKSFSLPYGDREYITVNADAGQIIYIRVDENSDDSVYGYLYDDYNWGEVQAGRYGSDLETFGDYYKGTEVEYKVKDSGIYVIVVENWASDEYRSGVLYYTVYTKHTSLTTLFSVGIFIFPSVGMIIFMGGAAIADFKLKK